MFMPIADPSISLGENTDHSGYPDRMRRTRLAALLREHGMHVSGKRVLRLLRAHGLLAPQRARGRR